MEHSMTAAPEAVSAAAAVDLPPFLFLKKPVMMHSTGHSAISEILPASTGLRNQQSSGAPAASNDAEMSRCASVAAPFNDIDYDEQIRAPRMNYTYSNARGALATATGHKDSCDSKETVAVTPAAASPTSEAKQHYEPATFDLTQLTRRPLAPNADVTEAVTTAILDYTTNNYIYERNLGPRKVVRTESRDKAPSIQRQPTGQSAESHKLSKALENLNNNAMSRERQPGSSAGAAATAPGRIKNRTSNLVTPHHLSHRNGTELQQVYELKKPLCMPAVLRPIATSGAPMLSTSRPQTPADEAAEAPGSGSGGDSPSTPHLQIRAYPFPSTAPPLTPTAGAGDSLTAIKVSHVQPREPTHEHWKPNNYASHCMRCFDPFGGFFTPQRKRRHHCRFCGLIFCFDCLWQNDNDSTAEEASAGTAAGGNVALNRLSRSDSAGSIVGSGNGSSLGSSLGGKLFTSASNPLLSGLTSTESVGGVLLDSEANFVVPINLVILKTGLSLHLGEYFKFCKVCKECGNNYQGLLVEWNAAGCPPDKTGPFVFVENPFLHQNKSQNESRQKLIERGRQMSGIQEADLPDDSKANFDVLPNSKVTNVPSDWSWSSF